MRPCLFSFDGIEQFQEGEFPNKHNFIVSFGNLLIKCLKPHHVTTTLLYCCVIIAVPYSRHFQIRLLYSKNVLCRLDNAKYFPGYH